MGGGPLSLISASSPHSLVYKYLSRSGSIDSESLKEQIANLYTEGLSSRHDLTLHKRLGNESKTEYGIDNVKPFDPFARSVSDPFVDLIRRYAIKIQLSQYRVLQFIITSPFCCLYNSIIIIAIFSSLLFSSLLFSSLFFPSLCMQVQHLGLFPPRGILSGPPASREGRRRWQVDVRAQLAEEKEKKGSSICII